MAKSDLNIGLKDRITVLSRAKGNASVNNIGSSRQNQQLLNHEVTELLEIAHIQDNLAFNRPVSPRSSHTSTSTSRQADHSRRSPPLTEGHAERLANNSRTSKPPRNINMPVSVGTHAAQEEMDIERHLPHGTLSGGISNWMKECDELRAKVAKLDIMVERRQELLKSVAEGIQELAGMDDEFTKLRD
ncbi:hypothetical protein VTI74DRAFT_1805 [Chaetomium olivicolor]